MGRDPSCSKTPLPVRLARRMPHAFEGKACDRLSVLGCNLLVQPNALQVLSCHAWSTKFQSTRLRAETSPVEEDLRVLLFLEYLQLQEETEYDGTFEDFLERDTTGELAEQMGPEEMHPDDEAVRAFCPSPGAELVADHTRGTGTMHRLRAPLPRRAARAMKLPPSGCFEFIRAPNSQAPNPPICASAVLPNCAA